MNISSASSSASWDPALDAVVAAPQFHRVLLENEQVRVLETIIRPGDVVPLHTHKWPTVQYVRSWSDFLRRDEHGRIVFDSRQSQLGTSSNIFWSEPLPPHSVENVGSNPIHIVLTEIKAAL